MTASLIEYSEDHLTGASYISAETLREQKKLTWKRSRKRPDLNNFFSEKLRTNLDAICNLCLEIFTKRSPCFLPIINAKPFVLFFGSLHLKTDTISVLF
jgi:hypothetical protein